MLPNNSGTFTDIFHSYPPALTGIYAIVFFIAHNDFLNAIRAGISLIIAVCVQQSLKRLFPHFPYRLRVFKPRLCRLNFHRDIYTHRRVFFQWISDGKSLTPCTIFIDNSIRKKRIKSGFCNALSQMRVEPFDEKS